MAKNAKPRINAEAAYENARKNTATSSVAMLKFA